MLTNSHGGAVVTGDRDQYLGVVDFVAVTDHMRAMQEKANREAEKSAAAQRDHDPAQRVTAVGEQTDERPEPDREHSHDPTKSLAAPAADERHRRRRGHRDGCADAPAPPDEHRAGDRDLRDPGHRGRRVRALRLVAQHRLARLGGAELAGMGSGLARARRARQADPGVRRHRGVPRACRSGSCSPGRRLRAAAPAGRRHRERRPGGAGDRPDRAAVHLAADFGFWTA